MRPLSGWGRSQSRHTSKGAAGWSTRERAVVARWLRRAALQPDWPSVCKSQQTQQTCISLAGRRPSHSAIISAHRAFVPAARLCGCRGCPAPAPRRWQMAGLGSNMEVCLNVAEPQMDIFYFFLGVGSRREGISAGLPSIHAQGKYLLSPYYVLSSPQCERGTSQRQGHGVGVTLEGKEKKSGKGLVAFPIAPYAIGKAGSVPGDPSPPCPPRSHLLPGPTSPRCARATSSFYPKVGVVLTPAEVGLSQGLQVKPGKCCFSVSLPSEWEMIRVRCKDRWSPFCWRRGFLPDMPCETIILWGPGGLCAVSDTCHKHKLRDALSHSVNGRFLHSTEEGLIQRGSVKMEI